jgi:hypothetical protein
VGVNHRGEREREREREREIGKSRPDVLHLSQRWAHGSEDSKQTILTDRRPAAFLLLFVEARNKQMQNIFY